jgi:ribosomal protein S14
MENKIKQEKRCKRCGSGQTYIKLSSMERICRSCAYIEKVKLPVIKNKNMIKEIKEELK